MLDNPRQFRDICIVGGGFSGTLQAINLLRYEGPRAILIERRPVAARGVAYSTTEPAHLLNVRAGNMSAFPDQPDHFVKWLSKRGAASPHFVSRRIYGDYLSDLLQQAARNMPGRLDIRHAEATEINLTPTRVQVVLDSGERIGADAAMIAVGNLPPIDPPGVVGEELPSSVYAPNPWSFEIAEGLAATDEVIIAGTGLTMVDVALSLDAKGFKGQITAISRHGLLPRGHVDGALPPPRLPERPGARGSDLLHDLRVRAQQIGWRDALDELRPYTQGMWLDATFEQQARFLRHLRPWWDVHRHRLAPQVATKITSMQENGQLRIVAGAFKSCALRGHQLDVSWRPRGSNAVQSGRFARFFNCTGPQGNLLRTREAMLRLLLASGHIRPDRHRLGIDVNAQAETIDVNGTVNSNLFAIGPITRGAFWEIVAVPDIRTQTWNVARKLSHAHWVQGEGL
jgi:uncharacterized NAD(P)/FAD-binding protein YdhS